MDEKVQDDSDEREPNTFAGYTKEQLARVSRFNRSVIEHAKELEKAVKEARRNFGKVRGKTD